MILNFKKEDGWYIVLPDYPGPKEDLQMVYGADDMLDRISYRVGKVSIEIAPKQPVEKFIRHIPDYDYMLRKLTVPEQFDIGGQWYTIVDEGKQYALWLCDVTLLVFGEFPNIIQFKVL